MRKNSPSAIRCCIVAIGFASVVAHAAPAVAQEEERPKPPDREILRVERKTSDEMKNREKQLTEERLVSTNKSVEVGPVSLNTDGDLDISWRVAFAPFGATAAASSDGSLKVGLGVTYPFASADLSMLLLPLERSGNIAASVNVGFPAAHGYLQFDYSVEMNTSPVPTAREVLFFTSRTLGTPEAQLQTVYWLMSALTAGTYSRIVHTP